MRGPQSRPRSRAPELCTGAGHWGSLGARFRLPIDVVPLFPTRVPFRHLYEVGSRLLVCSALPNLLLYTLIRRKSAYCIIILSLNCLLGLPQFCQRNAMSVTRKRKFTLVKLCHNLPFCQSHIVILNGNS